MALSEISENRVRVRRFGVTLRVSGTRGNSYHDNADQLDMIF